MKRLLWMSDNPTLATGYARVTREILRRLSERGDYDIACLAWYDDVNGNIPPDGGYAIARGGRDFGISSLSGAIREFNPDLIIALGDLWMIEPGCMIAKESGVSYVGYFPLDGLPLTDRWATLVDAMDEAVVCSSFGENAVRQIESKLQCRSIPF